MLLAVNAPDDRVKIDNDQARVLVVKSEAGAKSELHEHKMNRVMIYLDPGKMTLTDTAGHVQTLDWKAGEALWSPAAGPHVSLNVSDHAVRIVEVELKSKPGNRNSDASPGSDWAKADPRHYKVEFDNDQVRVIRARYAPHEKGVMHEHPLNFLVVVLTDLKMKTTTAQGELRAVSRRPGDVGWGTPAKHVEENLSDDPAEVLVVEFKR